MISNLRQNLGLDRYIRRKWSRRRYWRQGNSIIKKILWLILKGNKINSTITDKSKGVGKKDMQQKVWHCRRNTEALFLKQPIILPFLYQKSATSCQIDSKMISNSNLKPDPYNCPGNTKLLHGIVMRMFCRLQMI